MLKLYCYPGLFDLPDNNPYGLKVEAFLRLSQLKYSVKNIRDTQRAPSGQLPFLEDEKKIIGGSNKIIDYLSDTYSLTIDADLTNQQRDLQYLIINMLDNQLYWVMSYSRWQDPNYAPAFMQAFVQRYPSVSMELLEKAQAYNHKRYYYQGIGRHCAEEVYTDGCQNLAILSSTLSHKPFIFGDAMHTVDASCFGFLANIYYYPIDTPLKQFLVNQDNLVHYLSRIKMALNYQ